jgi:hypothetical protein
MELQNMGRAPCAECCFWGRALGMDGPHTQRNYRDVSHYAVVMIHTDVL